MTNTRCFWYWAWSDISGLSWAQTCCRDLTNWFALYPTFRHWFNYNCLFPKRPSPSAVLSYPAGQKLVCAPGFADSHPIHSLANPQIWTTENETKGFIIYFLHRRCYSSLYETFSWNIYFLKDSFPTISHFILYRVLFKVKNCGYCRCK